MAVIQLNSYADFKQLVQPPSGVYYWVDELDAWWYAYAHVGNDWLWLMNNTADNFGTFKNDFPKAVALQNGLTFPSGGG